MHRLRPFILRRSAARPFTTLNASESINNTLLHVSSLDISKDEGELLTLLNTLPPVPQTVLPIVESILQRKRKQRLGATITERQCEDFKANNSPELFQLCTNLLEKLPKSSECARVQRLLLFSPQNPAVPSSMKTYIAELAQQNLLQNYNSQPLAMLAHLIQTEVFPDFTVLGAESPPQVTVTQNFDELLIPPGHSSRSLSDTFYLPQAGKVLRTHTSAHQCEFLRLGHERFLLVGDVYRRDEIDRTHFPVFHQMEGVKLLPKGATREDAFLDLQHTLDRLVGVLFPSCTNKKWLSCYFPFTEPSLELEILFRNRLVEMLGCGVIQPKILESCQLSDRVGWAFGLGLERLAMVWFDVPDIRLFWSKEKEVTNQFLNCWDRYSVTKQPVQFLPIVSQFPSFVRELSVWLPETGFYSNDLFSIVREIAGNEVEECTEVEEFVHPQTGRRSKLFRMKFHSDVRQVEKEEVLLWMQRIAKQCEDQLHVKVR